MMAKHTFALLAALGLAACHEGAKGHEHGSGDASNATGSLRLDDGKKWATDPPLRTGMTAIRDELQRSLEPIHAKTYSNDDFKALADKIDTQAGQIVQSCKLPKEVDDQLHLVLAQISAGTQQMKSDGDRMAGAVKVIGALEAYAKHFDHPDWKPLVH